MHEHYDIGKHVLNTHFCLNSIAYAENEIIVDETENEVIVDETENEVIVDETENQGINSIVYNGESKY